MSEFIFGNKVTAYFYKELCNSLMKSMWKSFCARTGEIDFLATDKFELVLGEAVAPVLAENCDYALSITEAGAAVSASSKENLAKGYFDLLKRIKIKKTDSGIVFYAEECFVEKKFPVKFRGIHFCIFPETSLITLNKLIRFCAALQYTHINLEFWGMLKFDCLKELAWENAHTKEEVKAIIKEIRQLGMEPIPMFNHFGHASGSRVHGGKHVVLDQNPALCYLFGENGWNWNYKSEEVLQLQSQIRKELYEVFGEGEYINIGFDEAYGYGDNVDTADEIALFLKNTVNQVLNEGRRPIIWGDMLLNRELLASVDENDYICSAMEKVIAEKLINALDKRVIIADWQYNTKKAPVKTVDYFKALGFEVLGCPWESVENALSVSETVCNSDALGVLETTWHTLRKDYDAIYAVSAYCCGEPIPRNRAEYWLKIAALLRSVNEKYNGYLECGWVEEQIFKSMIE